MPDMAQFGALLKAGRERKRLSQEAVARRIDYALRAYARLEAGDTMNPGPVRVGKLSRLLEIPIADLYRAAGWEMWDESPAEVAGVVEVWQRIPRGKREPLLEVMKGLAGMNGSPPREPVTEASPRRL